MAQNYFWTCDHCRYRNSRYAEKCFSCSRLNPNGPPLSNPTNLITTTKVAPSQSILYNKNQQRTKFFSNSSSPGSSIPSSKLKTSHFSQTTTSTTRTYQIKLPDNKKFIPRTILDTNNDQFGKHLMTEVIGRKPPINPLPPSLSLRNLNEELKKQEQEKLRKERRKSATPILETPSQDFIQFIDENIRKKWTTVNHRWSRTCEKLPATAQPVIDRDRSEYKSLLRSHRHSPFTDKDFPTNRSSLYRSHEEYDKRYDQMVKKWLRLEKIHLDMPEDDDQVEGIDGLPAARPNVKCDHTSKLCVRGSGLSVSDFRQGKLGDCWLISSLISLVYRYPSFLSTLIPDPKVHPKECCYQVFLCLDGQWSSVIIDDYFPCDQNGRLVFTEAFGDQLFAPMIEKALAKHHSCYKALILGQTIEGFSTLTGMPVERLPLPNNIGSSRQCQTDYWIKLEHCIKDKRYIAAASCNVDCLGLHKSHAYSILDVCTITGTYAGIMDQAILLSNPWGDQKLQGKFERNHQSYLQKLKRKHQNGLFWMSFSDFIQCFNHVDVCKFNPKWPYAKRYEFRLPFQMDDQMNFTVFELHCKKKTEVNLTLYQRIDRDLRLKGQVSFTILIFKIWNDDSMQFVCSSPVITSKIENYQTLLGRGHYVVMIAGFNHWGVTSRLREAPTMVLAIHADHSMDSRPLNPDMHLMGDLLIQTVLSLGTVNQGTDWLEYKLSDKFSAFVWMMENKSNEDYLVVKWSTREAENAFNVRAEEQGIDIIPPQCRKLICIMARESDKEICGYKFSYNRVFEKRKSLSDQGENWMKLVNSNTDNDDEWWSKLSPLFAPRLIQPDSLAEQNKGYQFDFTQEPDQSRCSIS